MTNLAITQNETEFLESTRVDREDILAILAKYDGHPGGLIAILEDIQKKYSYLPQEALTIVCEETRCSLVDVYGIATFYRAFSLTPRGKYLVSICLGTACHVRGGLLVAEEFERQLGVKAGETTPDRLFTLETVTCLFIRRGTEGISSPKSTLGNIRLSLNSRNHDNIICWGLA